MKTYNFTAQIEKEDDLYTGTIVGVPGAHTQAKTVDELMAQLREVLLLCMEEMTEEEKNSIPQFIGFQNFSIAV
ncbi:MAG: type II toxin-antitoxin system HicB family antitoxin [Bacteroidetes bacterium]|nr:type II toxin-antitoxin system HicB family antitoxin [Bacteroidota bacterium]